MPVRWFGEIISPDGKKSIKWKSVIDMIQQVYQYFIDNGKDVSYSDIQNLVPEECFADSKKHYATDPDNPVSPTAKILVTKDWAQNHAKETKAAYFQKKEILPIDGKAFRLNDNVGEDDVWRLETYLRDKGFEVHRYYDLNKTEDCAGISTGYGDSSNRTDKKSSISKESDRIGLNTILYGPPGTGKTYNTKNYAVSILLGKPIEEVKAAKENDSMLEDESSKDSKTVDEWYSFFCAEERIKFVTFHQSYSYEEFIGGIKPVLDDSSSDVLYTIEDGVFKEFCEEVDYKNASNKFDIAWDKLVFAAKANKNSYEFPGKTGSKLSMNLENDIQFGITWGSVHNDFRKDRVERQWIDGEGSRPKKSSGSQWRFDATQAIIDEMVANFGLPKYPDKKEEKKVFIIDEINRGNISKIFGELITLIEEGKRKGEKDQASVTLPFSNAPFSVPSNIYILGTMNTADRSVAMLDTALRRRFYFIEIMPDPMKLNKNKVNGIELKRMLEKINQRLEFLLDREHTIGHAFFTDVKDINDLAHVFKQKILPLLQEYFFENYEKIGLVLNDYCGFCKEHPETRFIKDSKPDGKLFEFDDNSEYADINDQKLYSLNWDSIPWNNPALYIKIYETNTETIKRSQEQYDAEKSKSNSKDDNLSSEEEGEAPTSTENESDSTSTSPVSEDTTSDATTNDEDEISNTNSTESSDIPADNEG